MKKITKKKKKVPALVNEVWESKLQQNYKENVHISYSHLVKYATCPRQWEAVYLTKETPSSPSIHTTFGTAMHETIQSWLEVLYHHKVKDANEMELDVMLYENMISAYLKDKKRNNGEDFTNQDEMYIFFNEGKSILEFLKKKRGGYFTTKEVYLAGIETLLYSEIQPKVYFKGKVDLILYDNRVDKWHIIDIKTSTRGWGKYEKADDKKKAQILLYKYFFSKQFNIPLDKIVVEYFIVKRQVPKDAEFAIMQRRVQEFKPADGPRKMKQALNMLHTFVDEVINTEGKYKTEGYVTTPSLDACRFCELKKNRQCPDAIF